MLSDGGKGVVFYMLICVVMYGFVCLFRMFIDGYVWLYMVMCGYIWLESI